ncbi:putative histidine triad nucleotide binding protein [Syncephalis fuscata]|nr:putative histidine triad nucleotide binding protein [Syncephalis fuscata]
MKNGIFKRRCVFCNIDKDLGFNVIYEDETLVAFHDRTPAGTMHLLVVPREHVGTVKDLTGQHVELVSNMMDLGKRLLVEFDQDPAKARIGFHRPPFTSVGHLHMHFIVTPFKSRLFSLKYQPGRRWYMDAVDLLEVLKAKRTKA